MKFETRAIHAGLDIANPSSSIVPPISPSTIFEIDTGGKRKGDLHYTRLANPNRLQLEHLIADLEEGAAAAAFSSGIAAATATLQALEPGDHVIVPEDIYAGNRQMIAKIMTRWGLLFDFIDMRDPETVALHLRDNTRMIWVETPSNPLMRITDISAIVELAAPRDIRVACDNTWPTPVNQLPLKLGVDLVIHSTSKYFGGHSDLLGGAVVCREEDDFFRIVRTNQQMGGAVPSPQDCWMFCRSTRTIAYRMRGHNEHAGELAEYLSDHPKVSRVHYPGLPSHPQHDLAARQMSGFGGMISFEIDGSEKEAISIVGRSRLIKRATSLGGVESTWEHRRSSEGPGTITPDNLIRLSVGLEHPDDLKEDLERALRD